MSSDASMVISRVRRRRGSRLGRPVHIEFREQVALNGDILLFDVLFHPGPVRSASPHDAVRALAILPSPRGSLRGLGGLLARLFIRSLPLAALIETLNGIRAV
jgi:hypothetical protein